MRRPVICSVMGEEKKPVSKNTVTIKKVIYGGFGLAHHEGETLFVPYTAPGDVIEFAVTSRKKKCLYGEILNIVEPSPARITPECPVFSKCGGCHFLHIGYDDEIEIKKATVLESLKRIGRIDIEIKDVIVSPSRSGYRNHSIFWFDPEGKPGFKIRESSTVVPFPEEGCLLLPEKMREAIRNIPDEFRNTSSGIRVRMDKYDAINFWGLKGYVSPPDLLMEAGGYNFPVSPEAFFQINRYLNDDLIKLALSLPTGIRRNLVDLYCGVGFFTFPLSKIAEKTIGIERNPQTISNALAALKLNSIENVRFRKGTAEREIHNVREADLLIADPPRSGIPLSVLKGIIRLRPRELIMVSCEPPTFSRDSARLIDAGYILSSVNLVDMFPGTYHVETVGLFRRS